MARPDHITESEPNCWTDPTADPAVVAESLRNIARANRWFGGAAAVRFGLAGPWPACPPGTTLSLLDLGTGLGDLPRAAVRWGAARGIRVVPVGLELQPRRPRRWPGRRAFPPRVALRRVPHRSRDKSVDIVLVSQVAHHLTRASVVQPAPHL